jgi:methyl-accepting chemotaxis protein
MLAFLKISHKVYLMGAIQLALIFIVGWISVSQMNKIGNEIEDITEKDIPLTNSLTLLAEHQLQQAILFERAILKGVLVGQNYPGAKEKFDSIALEATTLSNKVMSELSEIELFVEDNISKLHSAKAAEEYRHILKKVGVISKASVILRQDIQSALDAIRKGNLDGGLKKALAVEALEDTLNAKLVTLLNDVQAFTLKAAMHAEADEHAAIKLISGALIIALIIGLIMPFVIGKAITAPIKILSGRLDEVANGDGDLRLRLDDSAKDEMADLARAFNVFMEKLSQTIKNVSISADELGQSSETAIRIMEKTLSNVETQRDETSLVSDAMAGMRAATEQVAATTSEAAKVAESAKQRVSDGKDSAKETQVIIKQLASEVSTASSVIESLAAETNNIGNVLEAIRGIAEQTNLLALNAAIEAARAGDTGRGFAVVADEVRSLAQRTQSSTADIQQLVETLRSEAKNAVDSMEKGVQSTEKCLGKSDETAAALEDANQAVNSISDLNMKIAATAGEQTASAEQISNNVINISIVAEETSRGASETASANQNIAKNLVNLHSSLNQFQV